MRRNILITGASAGLGEEMARQFAAKGHNLALTARREDRLAALRDELLGKHPGLTVTIHKLNVTDDEQVFTVFREADKAHGQLDRIIVNAGIGKGAPVGTGRPEVNRETLMTNFLAAFTQAEAAMELFRARNAGHLVFIASAAALRGLPKTITAYAAAKAGVASLAEGLRMEMLNKPIEISTIYPGYIRTALNEKVQNTPLIVDTVPGVRSMVAAIEAEKANAYVPAWPWAPLARFMKVVPLPILKRII